jgi:hypothetical protein
VAAISGGGRIDVLRPYPFAIGWFGCFKAIVQEEGYRGLIKGALPMVIIGVSQALVVARQRHIAFMRLVENRANRSSPSSSSSSSKQPTMTRKASSNSLLKTRLRSSDHGKFGTSAQTTQPKRSDPWEYFTELVRVVVRHPFELLGVRMVTSNAPEYADSFSALSYHFSMGDLVGVYRHIIFFFFQRKNVHSYVYLSCSFCFASDLWLLAHFCYCILDALYVKKRLSCKHTFTNNNNNTNTNNINNTYPTIKSSLFVGIRQTLFNSIFIPKQSQQFLFLGIPTMLRVRRMLALPSNRPNFDAHAGLGGSVKLLADMLKEDGMVALLSCNVDLKTKGGKRRIDI